jgi:hypothetical protein
VARGREFQSALSAVGVDTHRPVPPPSSRLRRGRSTPFAPSAKLALQRTLQVATEQGVRQISNGTCWWRSSARMWAERHSCSWNSALPPPKASIGPGSHPRCECESTSAVREATPCHRVGEHARAVIGRSAARDANWTAWPVTRG